VCSGIASSIAHQLRYDDVNALSLPLWELEEAEERAYMKKLMKKIVEEQSLQDQGRFQQICESIRRLGDYDVMLTEICDGNDELASRILHDIESKRLLEQYRASYSNVDND
jgi:hypothetical protein